MMTSGEESKVSSKIEEGKFSTSLLKFEPICEPVTCSSQQTFIECCDFTADGKSLFFSGADGVIRITNLETKSTRQWIGHDAIIWGIAISADNEFICSCSSDKSVKVWNIRSLELVSAHSEHTDIVWNVKFTLCCSHVVSCSSDLKIIIWDIKSRSINRVLLGHANAVESIALSPNGEVLVSCSRDKTVRVWEDFSLPDEAKLNAAILKGHKNRVTNCAFTPHRNDIVASTSADCTIIIWNVKERKLLRKLLGHLNVVWSCSFLRIKNMLCLISCSSDHSFRFWDISGGSELRKFKEFNGTNCDLAQLFCCKVNLDQDRIAVTTSNGGVYVADIKQIK